MYRLAGARLALAGALLLLLPAVRAEATDALEFRATVYVWLPDVAGRTTFPAVTRRATSASTPRSCSTASR